MQNLKIIKQALKTDGVWKEYKEVFANRQMRFSVTYIVTLFNPDINIDKLIEAEESFVKAKKTEKMFSKPLSILKGTTPKKIDWESLSKYLWFQYQTSTYWKDVKKGKKNIFNAKNYIKLNSQKRDYWQAWIDSLDTTNTEFNKMITSVLGKVA